MWSETFGVALWALALAVLWMGTRQYAVALTRKGETPARVFWILAACPGLPLVANCDHPDRFIIKLAVLTPLAIAGGYLTARVDRSPSASESPNGCPDRSAPGPLVPASRRSAWGNRHHPAAAARVRRRRGSVP